nr:lon protease homolog 2, peroxisomal isoform X2 [Ipomoea batatas]GMC72027.1 lon protease homolog 2, peroxisomal isoform X2 [Ipomoea batatas]
MRSLLFLVAFAVFLQQELWQKENKGVVGILLVQDSAETSTVDPALSPGIGTDFVECTLKNQASISDLTNMMEKVCSKFTGISGKSVSCCLSPASLKRSGETKWRVTYSVVLGLCRFCVQEISTRGTYYTARITSLELTKAETVTNLKQTQPQVAESAVWLEATGGLRKGEARIKQLEEQNQVMQQQQQDMHEENRRIHDIVQKMEATLANFSENLGSLDQDPNKNSSNDDTLSPPPPMMIHYPL